MKVNRNRLSTTGGRSSAETRKFSEAQNVLVERSCADPDYATWTRTVTAADASPTATPPDGTNLVWDLRGYRSAHCYLVFTGGAAPTATLELWGKDETNNAYYLIDTSAATAANVEIEFADKVRSRTVFLRFSAITGAPTNATVRFSPE